jgi:hypothetical protein
VNLCQLRRSGLYAILWLGLTGCAHDSYLVVTLLSGDSAFADIAAVEVTVSAVGQGGKSLTPDYDATKYPSFDTHTGPRLSLAFTPQNTAPVDVVVVVKTASNPCLGRGVASAVVLKRGDTTRIEVKVFHVIGACPGSNGDGSDASTDAPSPDGRVTFPGCNPAVPATCSAAQTCSVDCTGKAATCVASGTRGTGEPCASNTDCTAGNACFDFSDIPGCAAATKICMRFCARDLDCAAGDSTGLAAGDAAAAMSYVYPGGACQTNVECGGGLVTSYRRCSFACDPRADARTGCPSGLFCFLFQDAALQDSPDCGCKDPSRTGTDGAACTTSASCAPGFICNQTGITRVCRPLCKTASPSDCGGKTCTALSNSAEFGVCL